MTQTTFNTLHITLYDSVKECHWILFVRTEICRTESLEVAQSSRLFRSHLMGRSCFAGNFRVIIKAKSLLIYMHYRLIICMIRAFEARSGRKERAVASVHHEHVLVDTHPGGPTNTLMTLHLTSQMHCDSIE